MEQEFLDDIVNSYAWDIDFDYNYNTLRFDKFTINILRTFKTLDIITAKDDLEYIGELRPTKYIEKFKKLATFNSLSEIQRQKNTYEFDFVANDYFLNFKEDVETFEKEAFSFQEINIDKNTNKNVIKIIEILKDIGFDFKLLQYGTNDDLALETQFKAISLDSNDILLLIKTLKYCEEFYINPIYNFDDEQDEKCYGIEFCWYIER